MSKIQDAISKVQGSGRSSQMSGLPDAPNPVNLARHRDVGVGSLDSIELREVRLDVVALRRQGFAVPEGDKHQVAEDLRRVKRPILRNLDLRVESANQIGNIVVVTSANAGEGKSFLCVNLATSIASERDRSVLLVDGDLMKPHISRAFGIENEPGLTGFLADESVQIEDVIFRADAPGLFVLPAGPVSGFTTELLSSKRMREAFVEFSRNNPNCVVVFDSSPIRHSSSTVVLTSLASQVVVVVLAERTEQADLSTALEALDETKAIGIVLNQTQSSTEEQLYGWPDPDLGNPSSEST